jgi:ribulose 1,5-bisphosphate synthetase/thiazole synthase
MGPVSGTVVMSATDSGLNSKTGDKYAKIIKTDVVVLGSGAAGMSAAIKAKQQGVNNVIIIEKRSEIGENSAFAPMPMRNIAKMVKKLVPRRFLKRR